MTVPAARVRVLLIEPDAASCTPSG